MGGGFWRIEGLLIDGGKKGVSVNVAVAVNVCYMPTVNI